MALIIEDGTGSNAAANSYQGTDDLTTYATLRGVDLTDLTEVELEVLLIKAMDFLESQGGKFKGYKVLAAQPLQWPRAEVYNVEIPDALTPSDEIPRLVQYAQLALAMEAQNADLQPNQNLSGQGAIIKEKVGDIEIAYDSVPIKSFTSAFTKPLGMLTPLYKKSGLKMVKS